jgi:flagellin-like hook-associated protein FlgL
MPFSSTKIVRQYTTSPDILSDKHPNVADLIEELQDAVGTGGGASNAAAVTYDNTDSGLTATDVQAALDELKTDVNSAGGGGGGGGLTGGGPIVPTYQLNIAQDPGFSGVTDFGQTVPVATGSSFSPSPGDPMGAATVLQMPDQGLVVDLFYNISFDADPTIEGTPPNVINPVEGDKVFYSQAIYTPASPLDLSGCTVVEGSVTIPALTQSATSVVSEQNQIDFQWFTTTDGADGIYTLPEAANSYIGLSLSTSSSSATFSVSVNCGSATNSGFTSPVSGLTFATEHIVSFRLTVGVKLETFVDGLLKGSVTQSSKLPILAAIKHLFVVAAALFPNLDQADSLAWSADQGQYMADQYEIKLGLKDIKMRAY